MKIYTGVVTDNDDPRREGQVQVMIKEKDANTPKSQNTWCRVMGSNAFGLVGNVGVSSVLKNGTQVYCIFDDDDRRKQCYVIGTVIGISNPSSDTKDTNGVHPEGDQGMPDIHPLMQGDYDSYSKTQIISTESGHMIRMCDIQGSEQIDIFHTSGSCISMLADGSIRINAKKDLLIDVGGEMKANIKGNLGTEVQGTHNFLVKGCENYAVGSTRNCSVTGTETVNNKSTFTRKVMGSTTINTTGTTNIKTAGMCSLNQSMLDISSTVYGHSTALFSGEVISKGISLPTHTHMYTHGGLAAGPDNTSQPLP